MNKTTINQSFSSSRQVSSRLGAVVLAMLSACSSSPAADGGDTRDMAVAAKDCQELINEGKTVIKCWDFRKLTSLSDFSMPVLWQLDAVNKQISCRVKPTTTGCSLKTAMPVAVGAGKTFNVEISHRLSIGWENPPRYVASVYVGGAPVISHNNAGTVLDSSGYARERAQIKEIPIGDVDLRLDMNEPTSGESAWDIQFLALVNP
jgi:hypothetical protein